jgi:hypothetical protein
MNSGAAGKEPTLTTGALTLIVPAVQLSTTSFGAPTLRVKFAQPSIDTSFDSRIIVFVALFCSSAEINQILVCLPFERVTWLLVDSQAAEVRERCWREMQPGWMAPEWPEINEAIDRLLEAKRPRAAFHMAQFAFKQVETSRLKRLLNEIATCGVEPAGMIGHAPITTQLQWCRRQGVRRAIFTHCGSQIVAGDERRASSVVRQLGKEYGVEARLAYDGFELE